MASNIQMPKSMKNVTPSVSSLHSTESISPNITNSSSGEKSGYIIKIVLIIGAILFLAYNLFLYFTEGVDILEKYFGINVFGTSKSKETKNVEKDRLKEEDLSWAKYPTDREIVSSGVRGIYIGNFFY